MNLLFINTLRFPENTDWVIFMLLGCTVLYLFLMNVLQRDASIKSYLLQDFSETNNIFQSWIVIGIIVTVLSATLLSYYIPVVPPQISALHIFGYEMSTFGFALFSVAVFYSSKAAFTYLFYQFLGGGSKWSLFSSVSSKFYLIYSLLLITACFCQYFFSVEWQGSHYALDGETAFKTYLYTAAGILIFKNAYYLFNRNQILPFTWYYKILYICTLQIAPVLALWKLLFI